MKINELAIKQQTLTYVFAIVLVVFGLIGYTNLSLDLMPDISTPFISVSTILPNASPETVEKSVTNEIEELVSTIPGIDSLISKTSYGISLVIILFELEVDDEYALQEVRDKLSTVTRVLPTDAQTPVIQKLSIMERPVVSLALTGDYPIRDMTHWADDILKERLQQVMGVGDVRIVGGRDREIRVWLSVDKLEQFRIGVDEISNAFNIQHVDIPGGRLETSDKEFVLTTKGRFEQLSNLRKMIVAYRNGAAIRLEDVARIEDGLSERRTVSRYNGIPSVSLLVSKLSDANTVDVSERVQHLLPELRKALPDDVDIVVTENMAKYIKNTVDQSLEEMIWGGIMAVLVTFFFLRNTRSTFIVALILPITIMSAFFFLNVLGYTINNVSLLALTLSVGILIDDAIVMVENIWRHMEMGKTRLQAAKDGSSQIAFTVVAISLSILAVFVPIAFTTGIVGRVLTQLGITVSIVIVISLILALTFTPMLSSRFLVEPVGKKNYLIRLIERFLDFLDHIYAQILGWALKHRFWTIVIGIVALSLTIVAVQQVPMEFMASQDRSEFYVTLEAPPGTLLEDMEASIEEIESYFSTQPVVRDMFAVIAGDAMEAVNKATLTIRLVSLDEREHSQDEIMSHYRKALRPVIEQIPVDLSYTIEAEGMGGTRYPLTILISGPNLDDLHKISKRVLAGWNEIPGIVDAKTSLQSGKPEISIYPGRNTAAHANVNILSLASTIYSLVGGKEIGTFDEENEQYDIRMQLELEDRNSAADLQRLLVRSNTGALIQLGSIARFDKGESIVQIDHEDRQRSATLTANLENAVLGEVLDPALEIANSITAEYGPAYKVDIRGQSKSMMDSMQSMMFAMFLGFLMIYLIMAAQFNSFIHPITVILAIPFSFVGAFFALFISNTTINMMSLIALVLLMGLVVKNSILLISFTNDMRNQGMNKHEALKKAGPMRLRPILMTTFAIIFGMIPVALGLGEGAEMRAPVGVTIIGGVTTSTLLTLIVIPVVYSLLDGVVNNRFTKWLQRIIKKQHIQEMVSKTQD